jgi:hypothetical protein
MYKCKHCDLDPHSCRIREAVIQLCGVWLCKHHYETREMVMGHLLGPESAREYRQWMHLMDMPQTDYPGVRRA